MAKKWKVGVIGCGAVAQVVHMPGYLKTPGVDLVAACDPEPKRRKEVMQFGDVRTYPDYREMLASEKLDVVSVCSPNRFHAEHAIAALKAGAHVLLEKPAATSMKEIAAIKAAVKRSGRVLVVGFSHRFHRGNIKAKRLIEAGTIGQPYMIRIRLAHSGPYKGWAKSDWFYSPELAGGGVMLDMGIHAIDQALWMCGPVRSVQAMAATLRKKIEVDDNALLLLDFASGKTLGCIEVGWTSPTGFNGLEVLGDDGSIHIDYAGQMTMTTGKVTPNAKTLSTRKTRVLDRAPLTGGWRVEVKEIIGHMRRGSDCGIGIDVGGAALAVALAGYESSRSGKRVVLAW